jgi:predicted  nucleic acid-binding Zn-ribbon protein
MNIAPLSSHLSYSLKQLSEIKYNKMTTIDMLTKRKDDYQRAHDKLLNQLDDISERYYKNTEIPPEVVKKITAMNKDVLEVEKIIDNITAAIGVIETEL